MQFTFRKPLVNIGRGAYSIHGKRGHRSFTASIAGTETFDRPHNSFSSFGVKKSATIQGVTRGPLFSHSAKTKKTSGKSSTGHIPGTSTLTSTHHHIDVNMYKAGAIAGGGLAAYGGYKMYRHHRKKEQLKRQMMMYHQPHMGVPQAATFHNTHMQLGSGGY